MKKPNVITSSTKYDIIMIVEEVEVEVEVRT